MDDTFADNLSFVVIRGGGGGEIMSLLSLRIAWPAWLKQLFAMARAGQAARSAALWLRLAFSPVPFRVLLSASLINHVNDVNDDDDGDDDDDEDEDEEEEDDDILFHHCAYACKQTTRDSESHQRNKTTKNCSHSCQPWMIKPLVCLIGGVNHNHPLSIQG